MVENLTYKTWYRGYYDCIEPIGYVVSREKFEAQWWATEYQNLESANVPLEYREIDSGQEPRVCFIAHMSDIHHKDMMYETKGTR